MSTHGGSMLRKNYFDNVSEGEPEVIVVGDYLQWKRTDLAKEYDPSLYTAVYIGRIAGGSNEINITATNETTHFLFTASSTVTELYNVGDYHWQVEIIRNADSERIVVERGHNQIVPDLDINSADPRSHAEIMLSKIEGLLEGKADADVSSYSIAGRSLTKMTFEELTQAEAYFNSKVIAEKAKLNAQNHKETGATVKVRF